MDLINLGRTVGRILGSSRLFEVLLILPRIALMVPKLMADKRVPTRTKLALAGLAAYLVSPWDLIPDFIPGLGQLDDVVVLLLFIEGVLNQVEDSILLEYWSGDVKTLRRVQMVARVVSRWTPQHVKTLLFGDVDRGQSSDGEKSS
jgi:uncharacterized membrane protein YkvA (DUF1232 family)